MSARESRPGGRSQAAKTSAEINTSLPPADPYALAAPAYLADGWGPLPLPYGRKEAPPTGTTGYAGATVTAEQVAAWSRTTARQNVALRLTPTTLGIDCDAYGGKRGGETLAEATARLGDLPPTWRSSSRDTDPVSGILLYRVPAGRQWADEVGPGVEVIHHGHRYAVVSPSLHPEGRVYGWYDPNGLPAVGGPTVDELPELPAEWVAELDRGDVGDRDVKADLADSDVAAWLADLPDGEVGSAVVAVLDDAARAFAGPGSRHDLGRNLVLRLLRLGEQGHPGVVTTVDTLESLWLDALDRRPGDGEWERMVVGAVAMVVGQPTPTAADVFDDLADDLFDATPQLRHIRAAAFARLVSSHALLLYLLARVVAEVPPTVALPPVIGARASLNVGVAVVGGSGAGKSALLAVSRELLGATGALQADIERNVGSGEGLVQTYLRKDGPHQVLIGYPHRIITVDEIDSLGATKNRSGATIAPTIRSALTGNTLGQANATADRNRHIKADTYRLVMLLGVQPTRSEALLGDADAGTPQRMVWVSAVDPTLPDYDVAWPGELEWSLPTDLPCDLAYPEHIAAEVRAVRRAQVREAGADPLGGHRLLVRLKVSAALALLHGEVKVTDQWWDLAGLVVDASTAVQADCQRVLATERQAGHDAVAVAQARATDKANDDRAKRAGKAIARKVREAGGEWVPWREVRPGINLRPYAEEALRSLEDSGQVEVEGTKDKTTSARRVRYVGE